MTNLKGRSESRGWFFGPWVWLDLPLILTVECLGTALRVFADVFALCTLAGWLIERLVFMLTTSNILQSVPRLNPLPKAPINLYTCLAIRQETSSPQESVDVLWASWNYLRTVHPRCRTYDQNIQTEPNKPTSLLVDARPVLGPGFGPQSTYQLFPASFDL